MTFLNLKLEFIFIGNILPHCKEDLAFHFAIFYKKHIEWDEATEVEDINIVFNSHLQVIQRFHLHDWAQGIERQRDIDALVGHQWSMYGQGSAWDNAEARERNTQTLVKRQESHACESAWLLPQRSNLQTTKWKEQQEAV